MTAVIRQLDQRRKGNLEVSLLWDSISNKLSICCRNRESPEKDILYFISDPKDALLAFNEPYSYYGRLMHEKATRSN